MSLQQPFEPVFKPQAETSLPLVVSDLSPHLYLGFLLNSGLRLMLFLKHQVVQSMEPPSHALAGCMPHPLDAVGVSVPRLLWLHGAQRSLCVYHAAGELQGNTTPK